MATGWMMNGVCYAVQQDAIDAYFQSIPPTILTSATNTIVFTYVRSSVPSWISNKQTFSSAGAVTNNFSVAQVNPVVGSCVLPNDPSTNFKDGVVMGWGVAAAMITVYVIRRVFR